MRDKYNRPLKLGDSVIMPEPDEVNDEFTIGGWVGTYAYDKPDSSVTLITVEDMDGDCWDVEPCRVEKEEHERKGMIVEGLMTKGWVELLTLQGHTFDFVISNEKEAVKAREQGLDVPSDVEEDLPYVRLWVDAGTESLFPLRPILEEIHKENPAQMAKLAANSDPDIVEEVTNILKGK